MKTARWSMLAFALLLLVPEARPEDDDDADVPHVTVYGTATIQVPPNQMIWALNVRNVDPNSAGAAQAHGATVATLMAFLKQNRIAEETIQTSRMQLGENFKFTRGERVTEGYAASTDVQFTLTDFANYATLWTGLSAIPGVQIRNVSMDHSERIKYQNEARTKAVLAARDKAKAIAETLGMQTGLPLAIEEDLAAVEAYRVVSTNIAANVASMAGLPGEVDPSVALGTIPIMARVKAVFSMSKKQ